MERSWIIESIVDTSRSQTQFQQISIPAAFVLVRPVIKPQQERTMGVMWYNLKFSLVVAATDLWYWSTSGLRKAKF